MGLAAQAANGGIGIREVTVHVKRDIMGVYVDI